MGPYLRSTGIVDWKSVQVLECAREIARGCASPREQARHCFEWVRDWIQHSGDQASTVTTCRASDVLAMRTGWCFAKSHLLAALLRANGIPAGFCYQRLRSDDGNRFVLHGLNAVLLPEFGWYRIDPRGNKPGVDAQFCPPWEKLPWRPQEPGEIDLPGIWPDPAPIVVECLERHVGWKEVKANLPDIAVIEKPQGL